VELRGIVLGDRYLLESRIAAGGMGQVWLAADQVLGRLVAVKLLRPEYAEHPETLERFRAEARHAGVLNHPHIAQVYDYGPPLVSRPATATGDGPGPSREPYLVMEYVDGPSLADVIEREPLSADFTCDVIAQAAAGLDAAHQAGLVHRDIKPGNLLLTSDGRVKVTDFGIAHAAGSAPITAPGIVMGTSLYMAPERIAGGPGTPASDLYSLGIVMWECLMGQPPFSGASPDVMAAHLHQALPPLPDWLPPEVCELVARLTAKDPGYRLADAGLLAARLRSLAPVGAGSRERGPSGYAAEREGTLPWARALPAGTGQLVAAGTGQLLAAGTGRLPAVAGTGRVLAAAGTDVLLAAGADVRLAAGTDRVLAAAGTDPLLAAGTAGAATGSARRGARRQGVTVAVATIAVAGLVAGGLAASGAFGAARMAEQGSAVPSVASGGSPGDLVYVQVPSFHDQRYGAVASWLSGHGLTTRIAWDDQARLPAGTVVSVSPSGQVPVGATVTVTVAWRPDEPPPTAIPTGTPGNGASWARGSSAATSGGFTQPGAGTWPGVGSSPSDPATAPSATQPDTSAPASGGQGAGATPAPTSSCVIPVGPVCF
jgi:eukaryotic-like serine/threonine-protein kinase